MMSNGPKHPIRQYGPIPIGYLSKKSIRRATSASINIDIEAIVLPRHRWALALVRQRPGLMSNRKYRCFKDLKYATCRY